MVDTRERADPESISKPSDAASRSAPGDTLRKPKDHHRCTVSIDDYARIGYETGPALDPLAVAALVTLLDAPTLKLRLDAATLLADAGLPGALKPLDDLASGWFTNRDLKTAAATAARAIRWRITQGAGGGLSVHDAGELSLKDEHD